MTKKTLCVLFLYLASHLYSQVGDSLPLETNFVELTPSSNFNLALNKLDLIKQNNNAVFTIMHFGDSHIQGDYFSGEIRKSLHSTFGNAGQGILYILILCVMCSYFFNNRSIFLILSLRQFNAMLCTNSSAR